MTAIPPRWYSAVVLLLLAVSAGAQVTSWKQVPIPPLPPFTAAQPRRVQLPNGMVLFLQEDHELPLIDAVARIRGGSRREPANKTGLVDLYGQVWRTGGTTQRTGDQLDDFLEARAAKVETSGTADSTTIGFSCLKEDLNDVFNVFLEVMREPAFRQDKLDLAKRQADTAIARRNDDVDEIVSRESVKLAYGPDNPYARSPEYATIAAITREDLVQWHQQFLHPNNIILGVVGDFDSAQMEARLRQAFGSWPSGPPEPRPEIEFHPANPGYYLVAKNDVDQSSVRMVTLGITRNNPDYFAASVFNEAFAGGFSSRLISDIRTRQGLAYSVGGGIGASYDHPGMLAIGLGTKSTGTLQAIRALEKELAELQTNPISDQELKRARDAIINSFVFNFDSPGKVLRERMAYEFYGYPLDFLERYRAAIEKVTTADLARVATKYIHPGQMAVLVVGNTKEFGQPLSTLGAVTPIDVSIPGSPAGAPSAAGAAPPPRPTASNPEGKALMAKVVDALGGAAKVAAVRALREKMNQQADTPRGQVRYQVETTIAFPDRLRASLQQGGQSLTLVFTPDAAFMVGPDGVQSVPESQKQESLDQLKRDPVFVAQHLSDPKFTFTAAGTEKIQDVEARVLEVGADGVPVRYYVDPGTGRILRQQYRGVGPGGPFEGETDLSDWKDMGGITMAAHRVNKQNGKPSSIVDVLEVQVNPPIDSKLFERPAK